MMYCGMQFAGYAGEVTGSSSQAGSVDVLQLSQCMEQLTSVSGLLYCIPNKCI